MSVKPESAETIRAPESDIIQIPFVCGELGLPFRGLYRKNEVGVYVQMRLERSAPFENPVETCSDVAALDITLLRDPEFICPWCQAAPGEMFYIRCGGCSTLNCAACYEEAEDDTFDFCCASCGLERKNTRFGHIETLAVGEGGVTGELSGTVKKLQYVQAN